eukprot:2312256-Rhodomonas_salina.1
MPQNCNPGSRALKPQAANTDSSPASVAECVTRCGRALCSTPSTARTTRASSAKSRPVRRGGVRVQIGARELDGLGRGVALMGQRCWLRREDCAGRGEERQWAEGSRGQQQQGEEDGRKGGECWGVQGDRAGSVAAGEGSHVPGQCRSHSASLCRCRCDSACLPRIALA